MEDIDAKAATADASLTSVVAKIDASHRDMVTRIHDPKKEPYWGDLAPRVELLANEYYETVRRLATSVHSTSGARLVNELRRSSSRTKKESRWVTNQLEAMSSIEKQLSALARDGGTFFEEMTLRLSQTNEVAAEEQRKLRSQILSETEEEILDFRSRTNLLVDELLFTSSELRQFLAKHDP